MFGNILKKLHILFPNFSESGRYTTEMEAYRGTLKTVVNIPEDILCGIHYTSYLPHVMVKKIAELNRDFSKALLIDFLQYYNPDESEIVSQFKERLKYVNAATDTLIHTKDSFLILLYHIETFLMYNGPAPSIRAAHAQKHIVQCMLAAADCGSYMELYSDKINAILSSITDVYVAKIDAKFLLKDV